MHLKIAECWGLEASPYHPGILTSALGDAIAVPQFFFQPITPLSPAEAEILEIYRDTYKFYREVERRQALDEYCQWYYATADQHRQDLITMRQEVNLMGWFCRRKF